MSLNIALWPDRLWLNFYSLTVGKFGKLVIESTLPKSMSTKLYGAIWWDHTTKKISPRLFIINLNFGAHIRRVRQLCFQQIRNQYWKAFLNMKFMSNVFSKTEPILVLAASRTLPDQFWILCGRTWCEPGNALNPWMNETSSRWLKSIVWKITPSQGTPIVSTRFINLFWMMNPPN